MDFLSPAKMPRIPTYRVMSDDGGMEDPNRAEPDIPDEEVLTWYRNMLTGLFLQQGELCARADLSSKHIRFDYVRSTETRTT